MTSVTRGQRPHSQMHPCEGLFGLMVPMVPVGTRCKIIVNEREDYIGSERVQYAPGSGRPVMNVTVVRDDGQDCTVYAPTATATAEG